MQQHLSIILRGPVLPSTVKKAGDLGGSNKSSGKNALVGKQEGVLVLRPSQGDGVLSVPQQLD